MILSSNDIGREMIPTSKMFAITDDDDHDDDAADMGEKSFGSLRDQWVKSFPKSNNTPYPMNGRFASSIVVLYKVA